MAGNVNLRSIGEMPKNYMLNQESKLASKDGFPVDIVRLNSAVQIKPDGKDEIFEVRPGRPDKADIKENRIHYGAYCRSFNTISSGTKGKMAGSQR
jgi:hypothetical protein